MSYYTFYLTIDVKCNQLAFDYEVDRILLFAGIKTEYDVTRVLMVTCDSRKLTFSKARLSLTKFISTLFYHASTYMSSFYLPQLFLFKS